MEKSEVTNNDNYRLTVSSVDFGWGGSGALGSILASYLERWKDTHIRVVGSQLGKDILPPNIAPRDTYSLDEMMSTGQRPDLHLSVLDSSTAKAAINLGIRTVFVDLLPFLWGKEQREWVPYGVDRYLFQNVAGLDDISDMLPSGAIPIEAIIDPRRRHRETVQHEEDHKGYALLILGGLISPQQHDRDGYVRAVAPSVVHAVQAHGFRRLKVIGNLSPIAVDAITQICAAYGVESQVGYVSTTEFGALVDAADLVLGQPGLMTLLEVSASGRPFVRLPPQNVAGFVQSTGFTAIQDDQAFISWPSDTLDLELLEKLRVEGESIANSYCYSSLNSFTNQLSWKNNVFQESLYEAINKAFTVSFSTRRRFAVLTGDRGAQQAAQYVRQEITRAR